MEGLEGRVALITGAARGQGRSHAVRLAEAGVDIIAIDICKQIESIPYNVLATSEDLIETARQVRTRGRRVVTFEVDVREGEAMTHAIDSGVEQLGRLDIVLANAGVGGAGVAWELTEEAWQTMIAINLTGVWHTTTPATRHLRAGGRGGSIIITSSTAAFVAYPLMAHYVSAKHAVIGLMRALAVELAPHNIRVNTIAPCTVASPMTGLDRVDVATMDKGTLEAFAGLNALPIPWVDVGDISDAVLFLASDAARFITGSTVPVDAGMMVKSHTGPGFMAMAQFTQALGALQR